MRRAVLLRSVRRVLGDDVDVRDAAYVWSRHRWVTPLAAIVLGAIVLLAPMAGIDDWPTRIVLGLAGVAVAVMASTDYVVVAEIGSEIVLLKASRIRQVAILPRQNLPADATLQQVGGTILSTDWKVGGHLFSVPRSSEHAMERMAERRSHLS